MAEEYPLVEVETGGYNSFMHPALLYLRNALHGALFGLVTAMIFGFIYTAALHPANLLVGLRFGGMLLAAAFAQISIPVGLVVGLLLTVHARYTLKHDNPPPVQPAEDDPHVWPPPPSIPGS